jgi:hypothetical protein
MSNVGAAHRAAVPMSSARAEASRKNGARSRGPRTPEGKARSAQNALKHGLRAQKHVVLPDEDAAEFQALEAALIEELAPLGALQAVLAQRIAAAAWRLGRADRLEAEVLAERRYGDAGPGLALIRDGNGTRSFETVQRYRGAALAELMRSLRTLKALQKAVQPPACAAAPMRLAVVRPASVATPHLRPAARRKQPDEPDDQGNPGEPGRPHDRANPSGAPCARDPGSARAPSRPLPPSGGPALRAQPIEPERGPQPGEAAAPANVKDSRRVRF